MSERRGSVMTEQSSDDATLPQCEVEALRSRRTWEALRAIREILLEEEWFQQRPPLALAFTHPNARLYCEMWRTSYTGDLGASQEDFARRSTLPSGIVSGAAEEHRPARPAPFLHLGRHWLRNPVAAAETVPADIGDFGRAAFAPPLGASPHPRQTQQVRSIVAPLTLSWSIDTDTWPVEVPTSWLAHGTAVVDPTAPLFSLETYVEKIFRLPIGMRFGYVRICTVWLPCDAQWGASAFQGQWHLVRGVFSHVPAAVTVAAASAAATACAAPPEVEPCLPAGSPVSFPVQEVTVSPIKDKGADGTTLFVGAGATAKEVSTSPANAGVVEEDDWEVAALEEEALLPVPTTSEMFSATPGIKPTRALSLAEPLSPASRVPRGPAATVANALPRPLTNVFTTAAYSAPFLTRVPLSGVTTTSAYARPAAPGGAAAALPPPCDWWLRRRLRSSRAPASYPGELIPLYAHCVEGTRQWLEWLNRLDHGDDVGASPARRVAPSCPPFAWERGRRLLQGVSLCGWSAKYIQPVCSAKSDFAMLALSAKLEDSVPTTLPLRGLHVETTVTALTRLLCGGQKGKGDRDARADGMALVDSLVAIDAPYLRKPEPHPRGGDAGESEDAESLMAALGRLRQMRFLSLNHGRDVLTGKEAGVDCVGTTAAALPKFHQFRSVEELLLHGVSGIATLAHALVGNIGSTLKLLDLTGTDLTDDVLRALVYGTYEGPADGAAEALPRPNTIPLVSLQELRLTACHRLTRANALTALPQLRRLNLQTCGVRQLSDLMGCLMLEEVTLTRCEHITELHPLWQLPRLQRVEADGVRQLWNERALLPPSEARPEALTKSLPLLTAPVVRLNLSQASQFRGADVGYLACHLRDCANTSTLAVLLLDHTGADDDALRVFAGMSTGEESLPNTGAPHSLRASSLRELSLVGCAAIHDLGPLGLLPQLTRLVANHSGVSRVGGLERSHTLEFLSLSHCTRLEDISPLAYVSPLRCLDVSRTLLNDVALLRFVYPSMTELPPTHRLPSSTSGAWNYHRPAVVPSQVEVLVLSQCLSLQQIGCVAHLPRLRCLELGSTNIFDYSFVRFFGEWQTLLQTQRRLGGAPAPHGQGGEDSLSATALTDEAALLEAWRMDALWGRPSKQLGASVERHGSDGADAEGDLRVGDGAMTVRSVAPAVESLFHHLGFSFAVGAVSTLTHVSLTYCTDVRCITPFALFTALSLLDLTGTAVDSASLLAFVNVLLEACSADLEEGPAMHLNRGADRLLLRAVPAAQMTIARAVPIREAAAVVHGVRRGPLSSFRPFTLTSLALAWCHYVTDVRCCAAIPSLRHLDIAGTPICNVSVAALSPLFSSSFASPTGSPVAAAAEEVRWWELHHCSLVSFDVSYCRSVTDISCLFATGGPCEGRRPVSLTRLSLRNSGVTATKEELHALDPSGCCEFVV